MTYGSTKHFTGVAVHFWNIVGLPIASNTLIDAAEQ